MPEARGHEPGTSNSKRQPGLKYRKASTPVATSEQATGMEALRSPYDAVLRGDFSQRTFERHDALLGDSRMSHPIYARQKAEIVRRLQRDYGNRYVQRLVNHISRQRAEGVQTELTVGPAGDKYEREADQVANAVMGAISSSGPGAAQRRDSQDLDQEELRMKPVAQQQVPLEGGEVDREVENTIQQAKGGGQSLPSNVQSSMEGAFGADFSGVRVHTGPKADALNDSLSASAFTTGQDIFLGQGKYNPSSRSGQELLGHELKHVVQQRGAKLKRSEDSQVPATPLAIAIQRSAGPPPTSAISISAAPFNVVQLLMDSTALKNVAGKPEWGWGRSKQYKKILKKLDQYHKLLASDPLNFDEKLRRLEELHQSVIELVLAKNLEFSEKGDTHRDADRIRQRIGGMEIFRSKISAEIYFTKRAKIQVAEHVTKELETTGGVEGELLEELGRELKRLPTFGLLGSDAGPRRFVDAYNDFRMEYNNLLGIKNAYRLREKPLPEDIRTRVAGLVNRIVVVVAGDLGGSHDEVAVQIRTDFYNNDPEKVYEALGLTKEQGLGMTSDDIGVWCRENDGKVETLGGIVGRSESGNPFRAARFFVGEASPKAMYDAFLVGTDEALEPFVFPPILKQKFMDLSALAGNLIFKSR